jgi:hypothetical protein
MNTAILFLIYKIATFTAGIGSIVITHCITKNEHAQIGKGDWMALGFFIAYVVGFFFSLSLFDKRISRVIVVIALISEIIGLFGVIRYKTQLNKFVDWM